MDVAEDREAILKLHKDWWESNAGMNIPLMQTVFPSGSAYLMFNLNGHPYFNLDELTKLWEYYVERIVITMPRVEIMRLQIVGDMAYLAAEAEFPTIMTYRDGEDGVLIPVGSDEEQPMKDDRVIRSTEVYVRDDGDGNSDWKMWHFHCSPLPSATEKRPWAGDTYAERGLGYMPDGSTFSVVGNA